MFQDCNKIIIKPAYMGLAACNRQVIKPGMETEMKRNETALIKAILLHWLTLQLGDLV